MKKKIYLFAAALVVTLTFINVTVKNNEITHKVDLKLQNLEALACYSLEFNGEKMGQCCEPWAETCIVYPYELPGKFYE